MVNFTPSFSKNNDDIVYDSISGYMTPTSELVTFTPEQDIQDAIETIISSKISGAPVLDASKKLVGILSERDCLRVILDEAYHNLPPSQAKVTNYMSKNVRTIDINVNVVDAANEFLSCGYRRFPVVKNGQMVGQISRRDVLKAAKSVRKSNQEKNLS